jgi:hypothetical protein
MNGKMKLVKQEAFGDCGPACLAMVMRRKLSEVRIFFPERKTRGCCPSEMINFLRKNGVPCVESFECFNEVSSILTVPSLNHPGFLHYIVWDHIGRRYLDPTNEELRYPDDSPSIGGVQIEPSASSAILLWLPKLPVVLSQVKKVASQPK